MSTAMTDLASSGLRVAIVHYWFVGRAGGERVVEALAELFPQSDLFALVADRKSLAPHLRERKLQTSFLQKFPGVTKYYRHLLLFQPLALEQLDLSDYDLVISSESGPAKGVITSPKTCHVCYCHSPMRYIWDMYPQYRKTMNPLVRCFFSLASHYMRLWDLAAAQRVDCFVANSEFVASRIRKYYGRASEVIYPPVDVTLGYVATKRGDYYLTAGRLVDYKRVDLAVKACTQLGRKLRVIGDGPQYKRLKRIAGPTVEFLGTVSDQVLHENYAQCRALLFPGEEDFGIVPIEAQSFGRPVIAFGSGGLLETVSEQNPAAGQSRGTGIFFHEQSQASLVKAMLKFESLEETFDSESIREHSLKFSKERFRAKMAEFLLSSLDEFRNHNSAALISADASI